MMRGVGIQGNTPRSASQAALSDPVTGLCAAERGIESRPGALPRRTRSSLTVYAAVGCEVSPSALVAINRVYDGLEPFGRTHR